MKATTEYNKESISINGDVLGVQARSELTPHDETAADIALSRYQLQKVKVAAEENARNYATFLANMSDELRTPLNAILGFSELLLMTAGQQVESEQVIEYGRHINESGKELLTQIDDMLRISKLNSERIALQPSQVSVDRLLDSLELMVRDRAHGAGVRFTLRPPPRELQVWVDERRLSQALLNVLSNAVKFTPKGHQISLSAKREHDGSLAFYIRNTGIEINPVNVPEDLSEYGLMALEIRETAKKAGSGLPLSKRLVELHDGALTISSDADKGTTVTVRLPPERVINDT